MSDNIPIEIQMEIIEKVYDVKSLIRFKLVLKAWKSFNDSSEFIKGYGARNTQPHSHILSYKSDCFLDEAKYICFVDDDNETFKDAYKETFDDDGEAIINHILVSFDLITKEFKVAELPRNLRNKLGGRPVAVSNLRESLVVYGSIYVDGA
ncbi:hypothetical protein Tco_0640699 [Tanacetum coccineum]